MKQIKIFYDFKKKIKDSKNNFGSNYRHYKCFIISKEDILNWKNFYEYNKSLISNNSLKNSWMKKISEKTQNQEKPTLKILTTLNEIKKSLTKGICIINGEFIKISNNLSKNDELPKEAECIAGNKRIILELENISDGHFYICKLKRKD